MPRCLELSPLGHTWAIDLDGTLLKHNGYKIDGVDSLLPNARAFIDSIPPGDMIIIMTSRLPVMKEATEAFLAKHGIRFDHIIYGLPMGERILVNDDKPSGLPTCQAVRVGRNSGKFPDIVVNESL